MTGSPLRLGGIAAALLVVALLFALILIPAVLPTTVGICQSPVPGGPVKTGMYALPLLLQPGQWYQVGATEYGNPGSGSSSYGAIGNPAESYLPAHPDSFAELSVLDTNPANGGTFTFQDANALDVLPYMTGLRVASGGTQRVLYKRDVGYGQGPGQLIGNGQPYRLDVWWQSAQTLGVSKSPVSIELAPPSGTGGALGQLPSGQPSPSGGLCPVSEALGPLQLTAGPVARILPDGSAAAPQGAPRAVMLAIAAANRIHTTFYSKERTPGMLYRAQTSYDCSGSADFVLYNAGLSTPQVDVGAGVAGNSTLLEGYGDPGPGRWISIYANTGHVWLVLAGLAFDTADFGGPDIPSGSGPRWRQNPTGNLQDGLSYVVRHPPGL